MAIPELGQKIKILPVANRPGVSKYRLVNKPLWSILTLAAILLATRLHPANLFLRLAKPVYSGEMQAPSESAHDNTPSTSNERTGSLQGIIVGSNGYSNIAEAV